MSQSNGGIVFDPPQSITIVFDDGGPDVSLPITQSEIERFVFGGLYPKPFMFGDTIETTKENPVPLAKPKDCSVNSISYGVDTLRNTHVELAIDKDFVIALDLLAKLHPLREIDQLPPIDKARRIIDYIQTRTKTFIEIRELLCADIAALRARLAVLDPDNDRPGTKDTIRTADGRTMDITIFGGAR